jgi:NADPH:quinone reductase-like Zn-dependent oxidoreductase
MVWNMDRPQAGAEKSMPAYLPSAISASAADASWACWTVAPGRAEIQRALLAPYGPDDVQVRTLHSGISRGTELLVFRGEVPTSEYERMRAPFQEGEFPAPVKYGYASVGTVEQGPDALRGRAVFCLYPHQSRYVVPAVAVHPLPDGLPPARAVLAANMETAVNALWDAAPRVGDRIAVVGAGVVGLLVAWLASRLPGCAVELIDTHAPRRAMAEQLGIGFASPEAAAPDADLVIHASGSSEGLATALRLAAFEATVLELSWYGRRAVAVPLGEAFHSRRLTLRSSQVGHVATAQRARWSHGRRLALALGLLRDHPVLDALLTDSAPFAELPAALTRLANGAPDTLCQRIDYA